jgi:hypothetical protein
VSAFRGLLARCTPLTSKRQLNMWNTRLHALYQRPHFHNGSTCAPLDLSHLAYMRHYKKRELLSQRCKGERVQKPKLKFPTMSVIAILCLTLLSPCLAIDLKPPEPQQRLYSDSLAKSVKWEGCGELNNHTLECK